MVVESMLIWIAQTFPTIAEGVVKICMLCYTFDRMEIVDALIANAKGGHNVRFGADENATLYGKTRDQLSCVRKLGSNGVDTRLLKGVPLGPVYRTEGREAGGWLGLLRSRHPHDAPTPITASCRENDSCLLRTWRSHAPPLRVG